MQYKEFLGKVQHRIRVGEQSEAVGAVRATLQTLGERIASGEADDLAAQLPRELAYYLRQADRDESFELGQFYKRVARRAEVDYPDAVYRAQAVVSVLEEAVTPGEMADMRAQLPDEYEDLFIFERSGEEAA
jgi:uncharacterized protein (DUF2267 family)